jgi:hypothetical protein
VKLIELISSATSELLLCNTIRRINEVTETEMCWAFGIYVNRVLVTKPGAKRALRRLRY